MGFSQRLFYTKTKIKDALKPVGGGRRIRGAGDLKKGKGSGRDLEGMGKGWARDGGVVWGGGGLGGGGGWGYANVWVSTFKFQRFQGI